MKINIIGAGIIGLTTAVHLVELGHEVNLIAEHFSPNTTSNKAGAIWFPYKANPRDKVIKWSKETFEELKKLYGNPKTGVRCVELILFADKQVYEKEWWEDALPLDTPLSFSVRPFPNCKPAFYYVLVPFIEPDSYLDYLFQRFKAGKNASVQVKRVHDLSDYTADCEVLINCTGYGAKQLLHDEELIPIKGQIVVLENDGLDAYYIDDVNEAEMAYIFTRKDKIILGGTAQVGIEDEAVDKLEVERILNSCQGILPKLKDKKIIDQYAGIRPARKEIRLEWDTNGKIIHNYGHGGVGFTLAWGCAFEVGRLLDVRS